MEEGIEKNVSVIIGFITEQSMMFISTSLSYESNKLEEVKYVVLLIMSN